MQKVKHLLQATLLILLLISCASNKIKNEKQLNEFIHTTGIDRAVESWPKMIHQVAKADVANKSNALNEKFLKALLNQFDKNKILKSIIKRMSKKVTLEEINQALAFENDPDIKEMRRMEKSLGVAPKNYLGALQQFAKNMNVNPPPQSRILLVLEHLDLFKTIENNQRLTGSILDSFFTLNIPDKEKRDQLLKIYLEKQRPQLTEIGFLEILFHYRIYSDNEINDYHSMYRNNPARQKLNDEFHAAFAAEFKSWVTKVMYDDFKINE